MFPKDDSPKVYIASIGENAKKKAFELCGILRTAAIFAEMDIVDRNIKSQMKYADKIGAEYVLVIGDDEIAENRAILKNMKTGKENKISINEDFLNDFSGVNMENFKFQKINSEAMCTFVTYCFLFLSIFCLIIQKQTFGVDNVNYLLYNKITINIQITQK